MAFDRTRFQGAKVSALKDVQKDAKENNKGYSSDNSRVGFLTVEDGRNVFRILPPHNPNDPFLFPKRVAMLKCEVPVYKDGEETKETEIKNKNIFIATQHGGLAKDPIELYIDYVRKYANDAIDNKDDRAKYLAPITGWRGSKGWNWGINPKTSYVCFAVKDGKVGRLELYDSWVKDMDKLAISEASDDVISVDPFSDPNEGFPLVIIKGVDDKKKTVYTITKDEPKKIGGRYESYEDFFARVAVTDAQLEELEKQEPLSKMYGKDVYSKRDWNLALDGLQRFDIENKYGVFENSEFLDELEELEKLVPEKKQDDTSDIEEAFDKGKKKVESKTVTETYQDGHKEDYDQSSEEESDEITVPEMKIMLKRHIKKVYGEEFVSQLPTSNFDVQKWYSLYSEGEELPIQLKEIEPKKAIVKEDETDSIENPELSSEIEKLRARRNARK